VGTEHDPDGACWRFRVIPDCCMTSTHPPPLLSWLLPAQGPAPRYPV